MRPNASLPWAESLLDAWPLHPWITGTSLPGLTAGDVHVWRINLAVAAEVAERFGASLTPDERERAARFRDVAHRTRFIGVRGWLRVLLAGYLGEEPANLRFRYGSHGKPALTSPNPLDIRFNLSHSGQIALLSVARGREVGVDVELMRGGKLRLAERFFAAEEVAQLQVLSSEQQDHAFYRGWTRKEAFVKARGEGMSLPLHRFAVAIGPSDPPSILWVDGDPGECSRWSVHNLPTMPGYASALVVEGNITSLRCWHWHDRSEGQS